LDIDKSQCFFNETKCFPKEPIDLLEIHIPKLVQGLGSEVMITPLLESPIRNYKVVVSYDEGSGIVSNNANYVRTISFYFTYYVLFNQWGITSLIALMTSALIIPILIFIRHIHRKRMKHNIIHQLLDTIQNDRQKIVKKNDTSDPLDGPIPIQELQNRKIDMDPKDYAIISDLYTKIEVRNNKMQDPHLHDYDKREANTEILDLMEKAVSIEWDNYR
jgi:hypothetical protein